MLCLTLVIQAIHLPILFLTGRNSFRFNSEDNTVYLPPVDGLSPRPPHLPMAIPADLQDR